MGLESARETGLTTLLGLSWCVISATFSIVSNRLLAGFPHPTTVSILNLTTTVALTRLLPAQRPDAPPISPRYYLRVVVPLAVCKLACILMTLIGKLNVPLSYEQTGILL